jgi:hypothetical protein
MVLMTASATGDGVATAGFLVLFGGYGLAWTSAFAVDQRWTLGREGPRWSCARTESRPGSS